MAHGYLRHLANFAYVVDTGSITGAANRLGVSASVISDSVKTLEARVGEPLLERRRTGVIPTPRGVAIGEEARQVVDALDRAFGPDTDDAASLDGVFRISLPVELAQGWFDDVIAGLMADHPGLELHVMPEDIPADYAKFARDLYVRVGPMSDVPGLTTLARAPVGIVLAAAPRLVGSVRPGDIDALQRLPYLAGTEGSGPGTLRVTTADGPITLTFPKVLRVADIGTRLGLLRVGLGAMGCLRPSVAKDLSAERLVDLDPGRIGPGRVQVVIGSPHRRAPLRVRVVAERLAEALPGATLAKSGAQA